MKLRGDMKKNKCLYNLEMLIPFTTQTPYQSYKDDVRREQFVGYVRELAGTQVDALMCCPTAWRLPIYRSKVDPVWQTWARDHRDPKPEDDWKYFDKAFSRIKRYMLREDYEDPLQITLAAARAIGIDFFFSYRMNDLHNTYYNGDRLPPTMDPVWRDNPALRLRTGNGHYAMNYLHQNVRDYYYAVVEELVENYDIDGFELDFMRSPCFFPEDKISEGAILMSGFVRSIRALLDTIGKKRGKQLRLSARVPWTLKKCAEIGLDAPAWKQAGVVDLLNVSSFFCTSPEIEIEGFKGLPGKADVYGEMHFVTYAGSGEMGCSVNRRTSREIYETTAASLLERGADGVSLFNFAYVRDHHFNEARRRIYMNREPPFDVLKNICNREYLQSRPVHYAITPGFGLLPVKLPAPKPLTFPLFLAGNPAGGNFKQALLRLELSRPGYIYSGLAARMGDTELTQVPGAGELFPPFSNESLPLPGCLFFFDVPLESLKHGWNVITVHASMAGEYFYLSLADYRLNGVELAVYRD